MDEKWFILVEDDHGHHYVIPADKEKEFYNVIWQRIYKGLPDWADQVGGSPTLVKFKEYKID